MEFAANDNPYAGELACGPSSRSSHALVLRVVQPGARVLDVGCAAGQLAEQLVKKGCIVHGLEANPGLAKLAADRGIEVIVGDAEAELMSKCLAWAPFDVVIFADVLEHLAQPDRVLDAAKRLLSPNGVVICSIPNSANWKFRLAVVRGRFDYDDAGLFDRTHLRFYTRRSLTELLKRNGFCITQMFGTGLRMPSFLVRWWPTLFALQFVLVARTTEEG